MKKKKALFHQNNALCQKSIAKLHELHLELHPDPSYSLDMTPSDYWLKRMLHWKRLGSNEQVISGTEAYFEAKDKYFNKKGIESLEQRWNQCITHEETIA